MFTRIEQGLQVYKKALKSHLARCKEVGDREKKSRPAGDYRGSVDWPRDHREWKDADSSRLEGMAAALGLSSNERKKIDREASKSL